MFISHYNTTFLYKETSNNNWYKYFWWPLCLCSCSLWVVGKQVTQRKPTCLMWIFLLI